jgi:hypothetical protein
MSHWLRVGDELEVIGPWRAKDTLLDLNFSSLMFRREVVEKIGPWDEVRVGGDAEFRMRIQAVYGKNAIHNLGNSLLLSLSLVREDSLTRAKATHVRTLHYGLRWQYRDSYRKWHSDLANGVAAAKLERGRRAFPAPLSILSRDHSESRYDIVVLSDFAVRGEAHFSILHNVRAAVRSGLKVGLVHLPGYGGDAEASLCREVYGVCGGDGAVLLTAGDSVICKSLIVGSPYALQYEPESFVKCQCEEILVLAPHDPMPGAREYYEPKAISVNARRLFGRDISWIASTFESKHHMEHDDRFNRVHAQIWQPKIEIDESDVPEIRWRGAERVRPIVGRHGEDRFTRWPTGPGKLARAYGAHNGWDVKFLGSVDSAIRLMGGKPRNWRIFDFGDVAIESFLKDLDFFVHFPHERSVDSLWLAPMEAMLHGIPVILPSAYRERFGDAAVYAEPAGIGTCVKQLWGSESEYVDQVSRGRRFLAKCSGFDMFPSRFELQRSAEPAAKSGSRGRITLSTS